MASVERLCFVVAFSVFSDCVFNGAQVHIYAARDMAVVKLLGTGPMVIRNYMEYKATHQCKSRSQNADIAGAW